MGKLSESEKRVIYRQRLIDELCKLEEPVGGIQFHNGDPELYIRLFRDQTNDPSQISFGIPRGHKMIMHYAPIREWLDTLKIEWRDSLRDGQEYMYAELDRDPVALERTIASAGEVLFDTDELQIRIDEKIQDIRIAAVFKYPTLLKIWAVVILFSIFVFPIYELFHIFDLAAPSIDNLDWFEFALLAGFFGAAHNFHFLVRKPSVGPSNKISPLKWWVTTFSIWTITVLTALSTV